MEQSKCRLCGQESVLQLSHVVPSFVYRWIRTTSITKFMRSQGNPNVRRQDGVKLPLLCRECEQKFGAWEREFATHVFHPLIERGGAAPYSSWMLKFCVSVSWRTLVFLMDHVIQGDWVDPKVGEQCEAAERQWRAFLMGEAENPGKYRQHLLVIGMIDNHPGIPAGFNSYMQRGTQIDLCHVPGTIYTFSKMCGFIVLGFIATDLEKCWGQQSRVGVGGGSVKLDGFDAPQPFWQYLFQQAVMVNKSGDAMTDRQREITARAMFADNDKLMASHQLKTHLADMAAKGFVYYSTLDEEADEGVGPEPAIK